MEQVKLGIIGVGNMGTSHAKNVLEGKVPGSSNWKQWQTAKKQKSMVQRKFTKETVQIFEEGTQLLESGCCDAVLIAVPDYQHPTLVRRHLKRVYMF